MADLVCMQMAPRNSPDTHAHEQHTHPICRHPNYLPHPRGKERHRHKKLPQALCQPPAAVRCHLSIKPDPTRQQLNSRLGVTHLQLPRARRQPPAAARCHLSIKPKPNPTAVQQQVRCYLQLPRALCQPPAAPCCHLSCLASLPQLSLQAISLLLEALYHVQQACSSSHSGKDSSGGEAIQQQVLACSASACCLRQLNTSSRPAGAGRSAVKAVVTAV